MGGKGKGAGGLGNGVVWEEEKNGEWVEQVK